MIRDIRERGHLPESKPGVYLPSSQEQETRLPFLAVRLRPQAPDSVAAIRTIVAEVDAAQPVSLVRMMNEILARDVADRRLQMTLLGAFALVSLTLAVIGLYAVQSYAVIRRTREISLRMALGANMGTVFRQMMTHALVLTGAGLALGIGASVLFARAMRTLLYGVEALDPLTYAGVVAVLLLVALVAASIPALRAARIDSMHALRQS